jgi:hypothetical protein
MRHSESVITIPRVGPVDRIVHGALHALEGSHQWGYFETSVLSRGMWMRERLTLLSPETTAAERRALTVNRHLPVTGAVGSLFLMLLFGRILPPFLAGFAALVLYAAALFFGSKATRQTRVKTVQLTVVTTVVNGGTRAFGNVAALRGTQATLDILESQLRSGRLSRIEFELELAALYWSLETERADLERQLLKGLSAAEGVPSATM